MKYALYALMMALYLSGCSSDGDASGFHVMQDDIIRDFAIEKLQDEIYYFPTKKQEDNTTLYQPLERFDLIFAGYDINDSAAGVSNFALAIPGKYTHILSYIGKDSEGFAYAIEMNTDENQSFSFGIDGLKIGGQLYVYCLGSDFGLKACPKDAYHYGIEMYDHMWAKRVGSDLKERIKTEEAQLIATIKNDLRGAFPFQLPFHIGVETLVTKEIRFVDDGRRKGADCTSYFTSLFEEVAGVCLDDIRVDAAELEAYYLYDPLGQSAILPSKYNIFTQEGDLYFTELFTDLGYSIDDNEPRQTSCPDGRIVIGIPTPDLVFESPSMIDIEPVYEIIDTAAGTTF